MLSLLLQSSSFEICSSRMGELNGFHLGRSTFKYWSLIIYLQLLSYGEFGVPITACSYLHEQNQSLELTLITVIKNFELYEVGLFHAALQILLKDSKKEADSTALEIL